MNRIIQSFKDKRFRFGSFSTVMIIVAIALFVVINLIADQMNISHDLTQDQFFTLSPGSVSIVQELTEDVTIYSLWPTGQENFMFQQLLEQYAVHSGRITVVNRDPLLHPQFVERFARPDEPVADGSIIVVGPARHRVIPAGDLVVTEFDWNTWQNRIRSFDIEPQVTNAINFVVSEDAPIIYRVVGNNEFTLPPALVAQMEMAGYEFREVNLLTEEVPEDADMLFITYPERDWSPDQARRILEYLQNDGRAIFVLGYRAARSPRMDEVLAAFGIRMGDYVVIEGTANHFFRNNPLMMLPEFVSGEITDMFIERDFRPLFIQSTGIDTLDLRRPSTRIEPLIRTSGQAFGRSDPEILETTQAPTDVPGPFSLAVAVEDSFFDPAASQSLTTRLVVIGTEFIFAEELNDEMAGTNWSFMMNSLSWLREEPIRVFIPGRLPAQAAPLMMTQAHAGTIMVFSVIILPLGFGVTGLVVWLRRRNA